MRDALEVLDLNLRLPVGDRTYTVRPPAAAVGIRLANMLTRGIVLDSLIDAGASGAEVDEIRAGLVIDDDDDQDFALDCLGATYDEMLADGPVTPLAIPDKSRCNYYKYIAFLPDGADRAFVKKRMREEFDVPGTESGPVVAWVIELITDALRRGERPSGHDPSREETGR